MAFGERVVILEEGGHLGNLYHPDVQEKVLKSLAGL